MKLSQRLATVAKLVPPDIILGDIGADRGELSYYLLENNKIHEAILSDISKNSLNRAIELFENDPLQGKVQLRYGSGLTVLAENEVDFAVLAGMGGQTIVDIFVESPNVTKSLKGMVIQAMGNSQRVREYLMNHNFAITAEELILEDDHFYTIIKAEHGEMKLTDAEIFAGPLLLKAATPLLHEYLKHEKCCRLTILAELTTKSQSKKGERRSSVLKEELALIEKTQARLERG